MTQGGNALAAISLDATVTEAVREKLMSLRDVRSATAINFGDAAGDTASENSA
jgi:hypothetical protein